MVMEKRFTTFYYVSGILGAVVYSIPVLIFFLGPVKFSGLWLLYLGNFVFSALMLFVIILYNKKNNYQASFFSMLTAGIRISAITIIVSCLSAIILLIVDKHIHLRQAPANVNVDQTGGLRGMVLMSASFINFFMGLFSSFIVAMTAKRN